MGFYAANFVYDGIMSSEYGLRITSRRDSNTKGSKIKRTTHELYRRPKTFLLGVQQTPELELSIEINAKQELSATEDSVISNWLFGAMDYKKLQIIQPDMQYVYYNCIFNDKETVRVGNIIRGYEAKIECDSPFAWEYPKTITYDYPASYEISESITINNTSDNADYTYPKLTVTMNTFGGTISIKNTSDNYRHFLMTDLSGGETVIIDNDYQTISSNLGNNRFANFAHYDSGSLLDYDTSYNWLRYVKGENNFIIEGNIESISFEHQFARKIS